ncbi:MAG TPA: S-methyl-5-thioribose-1-phosphate isomerase [Desulfobacteraceae bacterium]|nr:S-methyl-5-thioribose-1-phosphate isomerase [Deltaproteobacteria bacterium]MBW2356941.1 S-methyl-5-thioribose-1-phosphate isomerase [Deltaproteobacteria bacterium]HDI61070.1 S-methyl-5-thioribose-1-phosphate isomerase [Desulfobacteraceae bacterium]
MTSNAIPTRPIWFDPATETVRVIDQRQLPHQLVVMDLASVDAVIEAIVEMVVRGAPLIGVTAAYGMYVACANERAGIDDARLRQEARRIRSARPTAVNLTWAVDRALEILLATPPAARKAAALALAAKIAEEEADNCRRIGRHGLPLIGAVAAKKGGPVNVLTHCNAGWLACVEYGTATAPIYAAVEAGIDVHVWVDETRPLNQGARLTAWELARRGIAHTVITDNAGGHLMQHGMVDLVIVGTDRTTAAGDVANKIGTYLKALAAYDNGVPFYVALPSSTFDWRLDDGVAQIPIEARDPDEVRYVQGRADGRIVRVLVPPAESPAGNYAFDVTPSRLVTGFITERGVCGATAEEIRNLFPDRNDPSSEI